MRLVDMIWTAETASEAELRRLFSMEPEDDNIPDVVEVCDGAWRYDGNGTWRFWRFSAEQAAALRPMSRAPQR